LSKLDFIEIKILDKKLPQAENLKFMGYSKCRCCGQNNGTSEFIFNGWAWPQGFRHYVVDHRVEPSKDFEAFIAKLYFRLTTNYVPLKC